MKLKTNDQSIQNKQKNLEKQDLFYLISKIFSIVSLFEKLFAESYVSSTILALPFFCDLFPKAKMLGLKSFLILQVSGNINNIHIQYFFGIRIPIDSYVTNEQRVCSMIRMARPPRQRTPNVSGQVTQFNVMYSLLYSLVDSSKYIGSVNIIAF